MSSSLTGSAAHKTLSMDGRVSRSVPGFTKSKIKKFLPETLDLMLESNGPMGDPWDPSTSPTASLMAIPAELRNRIFTYVFAGNVVEPLCRRGGVRGERFWTATPTCLLTSKQIYSEASSLYYAHSIFDLTRTHHHSFLPSLTPGRLDQITHIHIQSTFTLNTACERDAFGWQRDTHRFQPGWQDDLRQLARVSLQKTFHEYEAQLLPGVMHVRVEFGEGVTRQLQLRGAAWLEASIACLVQWTSDPVRLVEEMIENLEAEMVQSAKRARKVKDNDNWNEDGENEDEDEDEDDDEANGDEEEGAETVHNLAALYA